MFDMAGIAALVQIILLDVSLAGDNALAVGLAAAGLIPAQRHKAVVIGLLVAAVSRILLALFAVQLLHIPGVLALGGIVLVGVTWKMFRQLRVHHRRGGSQENVQVTHTSLKSAIAAIIMADLFMSLDNVLAIVGIARDHLFALVFGLVFSSLLMGLASTFVVRVTTRFTWLGYLATAIIFVTALHMVSEGCQQLFNLGIS